MCPGVLALEDMGIIWSRYSIPRYPFIHPWFPFGLETYSWRPGHSFKEVYSSMTSWSGPIRLLFREITKYPRMKRMIFVDHINAGSQPCDMLLTYKGLAEACHCSVMMMQRDIPQIFLWFRIQWSEIKATDGHQPIYHIFIGICQLREGGLSKSFIYLISDHLTECNHDEIMIECHILQPSELGKYRSGITIAVFLWCRSRFRGQSKLHEVTSTSRLMHKPHKGRCTLHCHPVLVQRQQKTSGYTL